MSHRLGLGDRTADEVSRMIVEITLSLRALDWYEAIQLQRDFII